MNPTLRLSASFAVVILVGGLIFSIQTRKLAELERHTEYLSTASVATPPAKTPCLAGVSDTAPSTKSLSSDADPAAAFIAKIEETLTASLTEEQVTTLQKMTADGMGFECLATAANLNEEERNKIQQGLKSYDQQRTVLYLNRKLPATTLAVGLAEVKQRQEEWLAAQLGPERYESLLRSDERETTARAARKATDSVSRINSVADLTETQRDKLYAGFLELNLHPTKPAEHKLTVETSGDIEFGPFAPDLSEDIEKLLTPDQLEIYQLQRRAMAEEVKARDDLKMGLMPSLMATVMELLESN